MNDLAHLFEAADGNLLTRHILRATDGWRAHEIRGLLRGGRAVSCESIGNDIILIGFPVGLCLLVIFMSSLCHDANPYFFTFTLFTTDQAE